MSDGGLCGMAVATDGETSYFFGGRTCTVPHKYYNTLFQFIPLQHPCEELQPSSSSPAAPEKTEGSCMVHFKDKLVLHGGYTGQRTTDSLHVFDLRNRTWAVPPTAGDKPPPLAGHTFTKIDKHRAVVYGESNWRNRLYVLDTETWQWTKVNITKEEPPARTGHAACCIAGPLTGQHHPLLMVVGGIAIGPKVFSDVWLLDVDKGEWNEVILPVPIIPRNGHSAVVFGNRPDFKVVVLFGGYNDKYRGGFLSGPVMLLLELKEDSWQVTKVVKPNELGKVNESLREKLMKLELSSQGKKYEYILDVATSPCNYTTAGMSFTPFPPSTMSTND